MSKKNKKYIGLVISDIHVGAMNLEQTMFEFHNSFIQYIENMKKIDFIIVAGDFFDHKFYLGDKESIIAHAMLKELIDICDKKDAVLRFVYGTESHEVDQYSVMSVLNLSDKCKVIKYAQEEELLPGMQVLYLPEEYLYDKDKYYSKFFSNDKKYDYIFGHGVIRETWKERVAHIENKEKNTKRKHVPIFSSLELSKCCNGQIYFGHFHINRNIDDKIFSIGSFSRWVFGEEGVKGFYKLEFDVDNRTYDFEYIENTLAQSYVTVSYGYDSNIFKDQSSMDECLNHMDKLLKDDVFDRVRFIFNIPKDIENPEATINYLREKYHSNDKIKVEITHGYIDEKRRQKNEQVDETNNEYDFISDKNIELEEMVSRFISVKYNKHISSEKTAEYLYKPLNEILQKDQ